MKYRTIDTKTEKRRNIKGEIQFLGRSGEWIKSDAPIESGWTDYQYREVLPDTLEWITDRMPTEADAIQVAGGPAVWILRDGKVYWTQWYSVHRDDDWCRIILPDTQCAEDKAFEGHLNGVGGPPVGTSVKSLRLAFNAGVRFQKEQGK